MTFGQLKDTIGFEAKLPDIDSLGGWLDLTIKEVLDEYAAQVRYDEMRIINASFSVAPASNTYPIPASAQHYDLDKIFYQPAGNIEKGYYLIQGPAYGIDTGPSKFVTQIGGITGRSLVIFPDEEVLSSDSLIYDYWEFPSSRLTLSTSIIQPQVLLPVVKRELIARASTFGGSKDASFYRLLAKEAHTRSMGATDVGSMNG